MSFALRNDSNQSYYFNCYVLLLLFFKGLFLDLSKYIAPCSSNSIV